MSDIIGILFGKPDGIIRPYLYAHDTIATVWRCSLLKCLGAGIKNAKIVVTHFAKPDASFMIDGWPHHAAARLREWIFAKGARSRNGRQGRWLRPWARRTVRNDRR